MDAQSIWICFVLSVGFSRHKFQRKHLRHAIFFNSTLIFIPSFLLEETHTRSYIFFYTLLPFNSLELLALQVTQPPLHKFIFTSILTSSSSSSSSSSLSKTQKQRIRIRSRMGQQLHVVLFPLMAHGHTIPTLEMASLFLSRGLKATIISTNLLGDSIAMAQQSDLHVAVRTLKFPPNGSSLPDNISSLDQITTPDLFPKFLHAVELLQEPLEALLQELKPNFLVSDAFLPWTADSAAKFGIPRLAFHGMSSFALCLTDQMHLHKPYMNVESESDTFLVPNLPHHHTFTPAQVSPHVRAGKDSIMGRLMDQVMESIDRSYGVVINSFYELESDYIEHYRNVLGRRAWPIGPLLLANNINRSSRAHRGKQSSIDVDECLAWLDSKNTNSVVYMCFGSTATFSPAQLHEKAVGLEASGQDFIWVVRRGKNEEDDEEWLPEGFEERMKGKGLIIRGWAPQLMILDHPAVGAFVTHCGWNSTLEGICAGVPMVTWPAFAEQFFNEKLVTDILKIGVSVGNKIWQRNDSEGVASSAVTKAVQDIMVGEGSAERRQRAKHYKDMARKAVEQGGSSYNNLDDLIQELSVYQPPNPKKE
ncbi:scopoletin glucosyltransferase-like [Andrographis paniculata]|uniref:scopoletin glucosyltransferase-like n=1 Tax=Andrographis paniculata TaxID=175694 RepID=UPI0021E713C5|nr:scopoletin glucosyltransferase-like [Andrographis paniculata]